MKPLKFKEELRDCLRFILRPQLTRALPHAAPMSGWMADWIPAIGFQRLLAWAGVLWLINIVVIGPFVLAVFDMSGATHRINMQNLPWLQAICWAPVVEELLFRFGLRHPLQAIWMTPLLILVLLNGVTWWAGFLLVSTVLLCWWSSMKSQGPGPWSWRILRHYSSVFGLVFHLATLAFAAMHLKNFNFIEMDWWMMVVLVMPQWITGLVLGWMRVQRNIASAMLLHGFFNMGLLAVSWLALTLKA